MKNLTELLRDADPLAREPQRNAQERRLRRQALFDSPRVAEDAPRRRMLMAGAVALAAMGAAAGFGYWSWVSVDVVAAVRFEVCLAEETPASGLREVVLAASGRRIYLHQETVVSNEDIAAARLVPSAGTGAFSVEVTFTGAGADKMLRASRSHAGKPVAILVDDEVVIAPVIRSPISSSALITGNYTKADAERIVAGIVGR